MRKSRNFLKELNILIVEWFQQVKNIYLPNYNDNSETLENRTGLRLPCKTKHGLIFNNLFNL